MNGSEFAPGRFSFLPGLPLNHFLTERSVTHGMPHATELAGMLAIATHHPVDEAGRPTGISRRADHSAFIDVVTQTRACIDRLQSTLAALRLTPDSLLSLTVYIRHHGEIPMVDAALSNALPDNAQPVRYHVCVADLAHRHYLVAISAQAVRLPSTNNGEL
jgi:enamine deaminase RidA (YjgF/YER057c/UK114 family)